MAQTVATLDARAIIFLVLLVGILFAGFSFENLLGRD